MANIGSGTIWGVAHVSYGLANRYHDVFGQWEFRTGKKNNEFGKWPSEEEVALWGVAQVPYSLANRYRGVLGNCR